MATREEALALGVQYKKLPPEHQALWPSAAAYRKDLQRSKQTPEQRRAAQDAENARRRQANVDSRVSAEQAAHERLVAIEKAHVGRNVRLEVGNNAYSVRAERLRDALKDVHNLATASESGRDVSIVHDHPEDPAKSIRTRLRIPGEVDEDIEGVYNPDSPSGGYQLAEDTGWGRRRGEANLRKAGRTEQSRQGASGVPVQTPGSPSQDTLEDRLKAYGQAVSENPKPEEAHFVPPTIPDSGAGAGTTNLNVLRWSSDPEAAKARAAEEARSRPSAAIALVKAREKVAEGQDTRTQAAKGVRNAARAVRETHVAMPPGITADLPTQTGEKWRREEEEDEDTPGVEADSTEREAPDVVDAAAEAAKGAEDVGSSQGPEEAEEVHEEPVEELNPAEDIHNSQQFQGARYQGIAPRSDPFEDDPADVDYAINRVSRKPGAPKDYSTGGAERVEQSPVDISNEPTEEMANKSKVGGLARKQVTAGGEVVDISTGIDPLTTGEESAKRGPQASPMWREVVGEAGRRSRAERMKLGAGNRFTRGGRARTPIEGPLGPVTLPASRTSGAKKPTTVPFNPEAALSPDDVSYPGASDVEGTPKSPEWKNAAGEVVPNPSAGRSRFTDEELREAKNMPGRSGQSVPKRPSEENLVKSAAPDIDSSDVQVSGRTQAEAEAATAGAKPEDVKVNVPEDLPTVGELPAATPKQVKRGAVTPAEPVQVLEPGQRAARRVGRRSLQDGGGTPQPRFRKGTLKTGVAVGGTPSASGQSEAEVKEGMTRLTVSPTSEAPLSERSVGRNRVTRRGRVSRDQAPAAGPGVGVGHGNRQALAQTLVEAGHRAEDVVHTMLTPRIRPGVNPAVAPTSSAEVGNRVLLQRRRTQGGPVPGLQETAPLPLNPDEEQRTETNVVKREGKITTVNQRYEPEPVQAASAPARYSRTGGADAVAAANQAVATAAAAHANVLAQARASVAKPA